MDKMALRHNWKAERLAQQLMGQYRSSDTSDGEIDHVLYPVQCPPGCRPMRRKEKRAESGFIAVQCDAALELMEKQRSEELEGADFQAFNGRKKSWQELAQGCITYMARLLVQLRSVQDVKERADLLHHRLESRRSQGVRTTLPTQDAIQLLHSASTTILDLQKLIAGGQVQNVDRTLTLCMGIRRQYLAVAELSPETPTRVDALQALVKGAIQKLLGVQSQMQGTRALAERALAQWTAAPAVQRGERVIRRGSTHR